MSCNVTIHISLCMMSCNVTTYISKCKMSCNISTYISFCMMSCNVTNLSYTWISANLGQVQGLLQLSNIDLEIYTT